MSDDKVQGMIAGMLIGNALGFSHTNDRTINCNGRIEKSIVRGRRGNVRAPIQYDLGMITEAPLMSLAINDREPYDQDIVYDYLRICNSHPILCKETRGLFKSIKFIEGYERRISSLLYNNDSISVTNCGLSRAATIALKDDWVKVACEDAILTSPCDVSQSCNIVYCSILRDILYEEDNYPPSSDNNEVNLQKNKRDCVNALWCAKESYKWSKQSYSFSDSVKAIVNLGGDIAINASIVGSIMGASIGFDEMMREEKTYHNWEIVKHYHTQ